ncbi:lysoplasmalogenase [Nocardia bovistercoris]|uniref:Lysoplasmalogenase n=1 Tax=Nocardia bovistercoris TaxID=2785916 RepID=A0A931IB41_9NOCA|nr:lysoplasmalogenase [Nocardia bovistercoris]MBH0778104.1 lysoplasmalogenase [Nocardia bovistercoris]
MPERRRVRPLRLGYAAAAAVTVFGAVTGRERWQVVAKPLLMPLLAADAAVSEFPSGADRALLFGALGAATVGDVLLIRPDDDRRLVAGASFFGVMQLGYTALWLRRGARPTVANVVPRLAAWLGAAALLRAKSPAVALPLTGYGATLGVAAVLASDPALAPGATTLAGVNLPGRDPRSRIGLGALLFTLSDGSIVLRRIFARTERSRRLTEGVVLGTYAAAQYFLTDPRAHITP